MGQRIRVLVVEDDALTRRAVVRSLRSGGESIEIEECETGDQALERLEQAFDCAFVDYLLPGLDGLSVLREARARGCTVPIVILTGRGDETLAVEAMRAGAADYLAKSQMTPEQLQGSLQRAIRLCRAEAQAAEAQERLRRSERRLAELVTTMVDGLLLMDLEGHYTFANPAAERILGVPADQIAMRHFSEPAWQRTRLDGTPLPLEEHAFNRVMRSGQPVTGLETVIIRPDGRQAIISVSAAPLRREGGRVDGVVATLRDITPRKQAEEALRRSEERFSRIFQTSPAGIVLTTLDEGRIIDVNESFLRLVGYERSELVGRSTIELGAWESPEERQRALETVRRGGVIRNREVHLRSRHGQLIHLLTSLEPIDLQGRPCMITILHDVSDRKRMEEALRASNDRLSALIEASPVGICSLDPEGRVRLWNRAAEQMFGWSEAEVLGQPLPFIPPDKQDEHLGLRRRVLGGDHFTGVELRRQRRDGTEIHISLSTAPLRSEKGEIVGIMSIMQDITEAKRLKEGLLQAQRMETVGRLAGGIAHDFNNLLAVIGGYSESLLRRLPPDSPLRTQVNEIQKAGDRGAALTEQLLAFSRRQIIEPRILNLHEVITDVFRMLRRVITRGIDIRLQCAAEPLLIRGDPAQMEQVLVNLALNARDAMGESGRLVIRTAAVELAGSDAPPGGLPAGRYVQLEVQDSGCGMDEELQSRIFEPFFTTKEGKGTGLGLSIVYGIVQQGGGRISVRSRPGEGATFEVLLPEARATAGNAAVKA